MVGSTGTVQNDGTKNKKWWFKRKKLLKVTGAKTGRKIFLASTNGKRSHSYIK
jgi:hypothetical protein